MADLSKHFARSLPEARRVVDVTEIHEAVRSCGRIDLRHAVVNGRLDLSNTSLPARLCFLGCEFNDRITLAGTIFESPVIFSGSVFRKGASFRGSVFRSHCRMKNVRFAGGLANFKDAVAEGLFWANRAHFHRVDFVGARFQKAAFFTAAHFAKEAVFNFTKFADYAEFTCAQFADVAEFQNVRIGHGNFEGTTFGKNVDLSWANVTGDLLFASIPGDKPSETHFHDDVKFIGAAIGGQVNFLGVTFHRAANFNGIRIGKSAFFRSELPRKTNGEYCDEISTTVFKGGVNFTAARIEKNVDFRGVDFVGPAVFNATRIEGNALFYSEYTGPKMKLNRTIFHSKADFTAAEFGGAADFQAVDFLGETVFKGANFKRDGSFGPMTSPEKSALPWLLTTFQGQADFSFAAFAEDGSFDLAKFCGPSIFVSATFDKDALFRGTRFEKKATFSNVRVTGQGNFASTIKPIPSISEFCDEADFKSAEFGRIHFVGATLSGKVSFENVRVKGTATFGGEDKARRPTTFKKEANFKGIEIQGLADFQRAVFSDSALFGSAEFGGKFSFLTVTFESIQQEEEGKQKKKKLPARANFCGARFKRQAEFSDVMFKAGPPWSCCVSFDYASFDQDADFERAVFEGKASFRETQVKVIKFSDNGIVTLSKGNGTVEKEQFEGGLDLRGCRYERIHTKWESLLRNGKQARFVFDHQPYMQLEAALRSAGNDRDADKVYLERRKRHRKKKWRDSTWKMAWLADVIFFWGLARYGIRPWRLLGMAIVLLTVGIFIFSQPGAVELKKDAKPSAVQASRSGDPPAEAGNAARNDSEPRPAQTSKPATNELKTAVPEVPFSRTQSFFFALHQFLPIDVPIGSEWVPSLRTEYYASILKVAGAILVPLGIAILTGLLRRIAR